VPSHRSTALRMNRLLIENQRAEGLLSFVGGVVKRVLPFIPGAGPILDLGLDILGGGAGPTTQPLTGCEPGFERDQETGRCKRSGLIGGVQRFLPGGETGFAPAPSVNGGGLVPGAQAPQIRTTQTRVCPKKFILGADGLCYVKALLPVKLRMHRPDARPPISASQWRKLRTANTVRNKAKEIAVTAGFSCKKR